MDEIIVVGAGFSGSIIARKIAEELNLKVKLIEKRSHIAGNMYDEVDEHGILVQKYGPHVIVTDKWEVIKYLSRFAKMVPFTVKELSYIDGIYVRLPFNFESIQQLIGPERAEIVINKMRNTFKGIDRVPVLDLCNCEVKEIREFGELLFEKSFRNYCAKQWDIPTEDLDITIMGRSAFALGYDERYMNKDFQYLPEEGFSKLFENILNHHNIEVIKECDALEHIDIDEYTGNITYDKKLVDILVFTGPLDELFGTRYGELPYRSLDITYEWFEKERIYPEAIISFPQADGYTRRTEYKYLMNDYSGTNGTVIATEFPTKYIREKSISAFYPVITDETKNIYKKYKQLTDKIENLFICGRLAEFKYYNMDECILKAFEVFEQIKHCLEK